MSDFVTEKLTETDWLKDYAPGYEVATQETPDSAKMCIACKLNCEKENKPWPPCNNPELNRELQFDTLDSKGAFDELDEEQKFQVKKEMDPVTWAMSEFEFNGKPWVPRWYQSYALRCSSSNKAMLWGRRCFTENNSIYTRYGTLKPVKTLLGGGCVGQGINPKSGSIIKRQPLEVTENKIQHTQRITLSGGRYIEISDEHPLLTWQGWKEASELQIGDRIGVPGRICSEAKMSMPEHEIKFLAYCVGDGGLTGKSCVKHTNVDPVIWREIDNIAEDLGCELRNDGDLTKFYVGKDGVNPALELARKHNIMGKSSHQKTIPDKIFTLKNEQIALFLSRLYACDGWACVGNSNKKVPEIGYCTVNETLARQIQHLLLRFGVTSSVNRKKTSYKRPDGSYFRGHAWQVIVAKHDDIARFAINIGIFSKEEQVNNTLDRVGYTPGQKIPSADNVVWLPIKDIQDLGNQMTYSVEVPDEEDWDLRSFIANDIFSHNTGKSEEQIIECLWHARWRVGAEGPDQTYEVHVFANSERLINAHWQKFAKFIDSGKELRYMRSGGSKGKTIELDNNVIIHFHVMSMKVVGLDAYYMWFDEAAFYFENEKALPHALAIRMSRPNMPVSMTSNSSGFRGKFYEYCYNDDSYFLKLPSYVNPNWNFKMEIDARQNYTTNDYDILFKAEWGESESAVFSPRDIKQCLEKYPYSYSEASMLKSETNFRCLGCDWNEGYNGVHFVIVEYGKVPKYGKNLYTVIAKEVISGEQWNHQVAEQKAWELLTEYNCDAAFLDAGGGGSRSVESLKFRCLKNGRPDLARNIVAVDMSRAEELPDPIFPGQYIKKRTKNLMVNQCQISNEKHEYRFPYEENEDQFERQKKENIIPQMRNFKVERVDQRGYAIYSRDLEEHTLTAWMLAVWGCKVNCTEDLIYARHAGLIAHVPREPMPSEQKTNKSGGEEPGARQDVAQRGDEPPKDQKRTGRAKLPGWKPAGFGSRTRGLGFGNNRRGW